MRDRVSPSSPAIPRILRRLVVLTLPFALLLLSRASVAQPPAANPVESAPVEGAPPPAKPAPPSGRLPWESTDTAPVRRIESPLDLLDNFGVQQSDLFNFLDQQPLGAGQRNVLLRILYNIKRFRYEQIEQWRKPLDWAAIVETPGAHRAELYPLQGVVELVERIPLSEQESLRFEMAAYHIVHVQPPDAPYKALVYVKDVPASWRVGEPTAYTIKTDALFVKIGESTDDTLRPLFVAKHLTWSPQSTEEEAGLSSEMVFLAQHGVDIGLFDQVRKLNSRPMNAGDNAAFYQTMAAARDMDPQVFEQQIHSPLNLENLLTKPGEHHGEATWVRGSARKITRVPVSDPDIQALYGIDHYYQIDIFIALQDQKIVLGDDPETSPVYRVEFPAVVLVAEVSPELAKQADLAQEKGQLLNEDIRIPAIFYRLWSYRSEFVSQYGKNRRQPAPMFIGMKPQMSAPYKPLSPWVGAGLGGLFIVALGVLWFGMWRFNRGDSRFERETLKPAMAKDMNLNELGIKANEGPDFSHLEGK